MLKLIPTNKHFWEKNSLLIQKLPRITKFSTCKSGRLQILYLLTNLSLKDRFIIANRFEKVYY